MREGVHSEEQHQRDVLFNELLLEHTKKASRTTALQDLRKGVSTEVKHHGSLLFPAVRHHKAPAQWALRLLRQGVCLQQEPHFQQCSWSPCSLLKRVLTCSSKNARDRPGYWQERPQDWAVSRLWLHVLLSGCQEILLNHLLRKERHIQQYRTKERHAGGPGCGARQV